MYAICKQLHLPTTAEHSLFCNFYSTKEKNLVVVGASELNVYRLNANVESKDLNLEFKVKKKKLECVGTYSLFGNIASMQSVRLSGAHRDSILMAFKDAKVSLVEYDPGTHDLKTTSLHYFEEESLKAGRIQHPFLPLVRVDPENRCAVTLIYGEHLVILPFRRDGISDDLDLSKVGATSLLQSPILSSYTVDMHHLAEKIDNIVDIQFLHGYFEPTLLILYEPLRTWAGRIAIRQDNKNIVAISLNIQERVHPIIWSLSNLPFDCSYVLPVPKPIGGVLVCAVNSLLYLNQSFPPYGVALNSMIEGSTAYPLKIQETVKISLDCSQACFLASDRLVVSLKDGEIYVLTLIIDGMRSVRGFNFDKAAASVITTCMCDCESGYLFLGSRVGNSLLLKYTEKDNDQGQAVEEPPSKKKRLDTMGDWIASDAKDEELDELEVYGNEAQAGTQIASYTFEVADSLINIAPCGLMRMGEPAFLSDELSNPDEPDLELVTTTGYAKNGAISILQRSIRPQVVTTFEAGELAGCYDMWTVKGPPKTPEELKQLENERLMRIEAAKKKKEEEKEDAEEGEKTEDADEEEPYLPDPQNAHAFLILSRDDSSMILETGHEMMELDHSGFSTQAPTVFAGNVGDDRYILQVSPMGIRLLDGVKQVQHIPIDVGSPITHCSVADPYIIIMSKQGNIMLLTLTQDLNTGPRLSVTKPKISQKSAVLTYCAYKDVSGMFTDVVQTDDSTKTTTSKSTHHTEEDDVQQNSDDLSISFDKVASVDDEDELLYGVSDMSVFDNSLRTDAQNVEMSDQSAKDIKPTYWCALAKENGVLEIYSVPNFQLRFLVKNFPMGSKVLVDSVQLQDPSSKGDKPSEMPVLKEVLLVGLGNKSSRPFLMACVDEDLLIYEAFSYHHSITTNDSHLKLRFKRINHPLLLREKKVGKTSKPEQPTHVKLLRHFTDVAGYAGVFVCGPFPHWIFMTFRGKLRMHPMYIDGAVSSFTAFHNVNCPHGFLYFNKAGQLRICALPSHLSYDSNWPVRKISLRCTPNFIAYHPESKTYGVATNVLETTNKVARLHGDEREIETHEKDDKFIYPQMQKFAVQLYSPINWEPIPNTKIEFDDWEHITCLNHVLLKSEETVSGLKGYLALGTTVAYGEEVTARGKIMILDVIEVVPEPGQPLTKNKIKTIYDTEQKGPVTAICHVKGYLVSAIGQKIYIWSLKDKDLSGIAFIDTQIYIHNLVNVKGMILAADIMKSISLLRFQEDLRVLSFVSRDVRPLEVYGCDFLIDNSQLGFIVSDSDKNILVFNYLPELRESYGGQRLLRRADFNVGSDINSFFRIQCKITDPSTPKMVPPPHLVNRHVTYFATLDGGIGFILPVTEKVYRRLQMLQTFLNSHLPHTAGLNPKAYRAVKHDFKMLVNPQKNILDGELLWKYINLPVMERVELAKKIGTTQEQIYDDLIEVDRVTSHF